MWSGILSLATTGIGLWTQVWSTRYGWKAQLVSFVQSNNTGAIYVKMNGYVLEEKMYFKMLDLSFSSKLVWGSYIISMMKLPAKKLAMYLYKLTICLYMEYCFHIWTGAPSCYLELLDKLQKQICRTVGPSLAASLEPLAHCQNVASLSIFCRY